jgi:acetate---CoA ligase (ADP-forming)
MALGDTQYQTLAPDAAMALLEKANVRVVPMHLMPSDTAEEWFDQRSIQFPVAVKVAAPFIAHKAKVGGVRLGCQTPEEVLRAKESVLSAAARGLDAAQAGQLREAGVYVQSMRHGDVEVVLSVKRDPAFGPLVGFGLGGWAVELWNDIALRRPPLKHRDIEALLNTTRAGALISSSDRFTSALQDLRTAIAGIGQLALEMDTELGELEANPLIVGSDGAYAVDALGSALVRSASSDQKGYAQR